MFCYHLCFGLLVLNYKCPNKYVFYCLCGFICDFLEFSSVKSSKIFTTHRFQQDTNFKHEKSGFVKAVCSIISNLCLYRCKKSGLVDFPEKRAQTKVKYLLPICQILRILPTETRENSLSVLLFVITLTP